MSNSNLQLPDHFPPLPNTAVRSVNLDAAHHILKDLYQHAVNVLYQDGPDPLRVSFHINAISSDAIPILAGIEEEDKMNEIPLLDGWLQQCAELLGELVVHLRYAKEVASGR